MSEIHSKVLRVWLVKPIIELRELGVKRPFFLITFAIIIAGLVLLGLSDTGISIADTGVPVKEVTSSAANNSSATATITITMTGAVNE